MDLESIKPLLSILIWGALFYFMMRFGCGAHVMGGHGHHNGNDQTRDPVCGMAVDPAKAAAAGTHAGKTYYFCSTSCRDKFEKEPGKYIAAGTGNDNPRGGHHHG